MGIRKNFLTQLTEINSHFWAQYISQGDTVIDGTMGNGVDTLKLIKLVGDEGKVYAFDIQKEAVNRTKNLLEKEKINNGCFVLINDSHENICCHIHEHISAAVFNLGYLPGGDHSVTTESGSTIKALKDCLNLLKINGLISVMIYEGHEKGSEEKKSLLKFASNLDKQKYHTLYIDMINQNNQPPSLLFITRKHKRDGGHE